MRPVKIQIRLRIRAVWSESSLDAYWMSKDAKFLLADNKKSDAQAVLSSLGAQGTFSHAADPLSIRRQSQANSVDPVQTPQNSAFDQSLHCKLKVKKIAFVNKEDTTDPKMGVSVLLRLVINSNEVCNTAYAL